MNKTIRNESRELLLRLFGVNLDRLSEQTRAEIRNVAGIANNNDENVEEMIERQQTTNTGIIILSNRNQVVPLPTI